MSKKKKILVAVIVVVIVLFAAGGTYLLLEKRGFATTQNIPAVVNGTALTGADAETPYAAMNTDPGFLGFRTRLMVDGEEVSGYARPNPIDFGSGEDYAQVEGVVTFRGNNYRDTAVYGNADITQKKFGKDYWSVETSSLPKSDYTGHKGSDEWSGSGWTGQPLIVRWDEQTRRAMNLYPEKKEKEGLTEIIYATEDGNVYFLDIDDGSATRDTLTVGLTFKGSGALDPRGVPMLFLGAGDSLPDSYGEEGYARVFIYSLIDGTRLYEFGANDPFAPRIFHAYDSSPLVDADTDTLIYPGENSVLYTMTLNTDYDPAAGTLSINPGDEVKWTYETDRTSEESYWWGMEDSAAIYENYMYVADNAGDMMCLDLNTMELVWAQDIKDDTNASPVFEENEAGGKFVYVAPSLHWEQNDKGTGRISIYMLNAMTGEIVWEKPYEVYTVNGVSGGVQATPVCGEGAISNLLICPVARTPYKNTGMLVALDKNTGEEVWTFDTAYAWSSPVAIYAADGTAYIIQCDSKGDMFLLDGKTGALLDTINLGSNIEASPAVFGNTVVVGTRGKKIVGVEIN